MKQEISKLRIAEWFESVQGEGAWSGIPSGFLRISGCNLRCTWCDTPYASWEPEGPVLLLQEIIDKMTSCRLNHVVVTGGEPMLFDPIVQLCRGIRNIGKTITIETAGTIFRSLECDLMSISPKLSNSTPNHPEWTARHEQTRTNIPVLQQLIDTYPYQLKFVVNPETGSDLSEIEELLSKLRGVNPSQVQLMPEGTDAETLHRRARMLVPEVMARNWRLTGRTHIDLFGNRRGT